MHWGALSHRGAFTWRAFAEAAAPMAEKLGKDQELLTTLHKDGCAEVSIGYEELKALGGKPVTPA